MHASIDVYYLLIQNFVHAVASDFKMQGKNWKQYTENSVVFIDNALNFPLELKKSYIDQLCYLDESLNNGELVSKYIFNDSCSKQISKLIQELDYVEN